MARVGRRGPCDDVRTALRCARRDHAQPAEYREHSEDEEGPAAGASRSIMEGCKLLKENAATDHPEEDIPGSRGERQRGESEGGGEESKGREVATHRWKRSEGSGV
jgi:hypothetical protein